MNTQFGVMALPSILLFHNSRPIFKYNFTDYNIASFSQFINILTGDKPPTLSPSTLSSLPPILRSEARERDGADRERLRGSCSRDCRQVNQLLSDRSRPLHSPLWSLAAQQLGEGPTGGGRPEEPLEGGGDARTQ